MGVPDPPQSLGSCVSGGFLSDGDGTWSPGLILGVLISLQWLECCIGIGLAYSLGNEDRALSLYLFTPARVIQILPKARWRPLTDEKPYVRKGTKEKHKD